jgi:hypothetical protein
MSIAQPSQLQEIERPNPGGWPAGPQSLLWATSIQRATRSKLGPRSAGEWHPLANIVHRLKEPAFILENRFYRWKQLDGDFCLSDITCCP